MADPVRFELELLGDSHLRRYRRMRPEVEAMPWDTLRPELYPPDVLLAARKAWTTAAFQEYRTGTACTEALHLLLEARAPLDLIALATRFPLDEMVHVELCARMAMALGGATEIIYEPGTLAPRPDPEQPLLVQAAELVTVLFCVGEALSIPLLRGTWHAARHPLAKAILGRIVQDEAAHGTFGFAFLDWALDALDDDARAHLGQAADRAIDSVRVNWHDLQRRPPSDSDAHALAWMQTDAYLALATRSLRRLVMAPLVARGIPLAPRDPFGARLPPATSA